uniref:Uncharacterized protein n=1 Tax=Rhizophora mucronata TaxID=61149 RepID=A0A2P2PW40_RHIMU
MSQLSLRYSVVFSTSVCTGMECEWCFKMVISLIRLDSKIIILFIACAIQFWHLDVA